ncbi:TPA: hypothetical protein ACS3VG_004672 [Klebsiella aerogenes]|uniref:hypothetical protein n=2 Tax=Klebsiella aerogenes TaxID=548 RepID=UPI000452296F|nr:hypothetical protein [Klebsiella aerogenes]DAM44653.1 MAG TPA: hypothetical protein [Caudoviricetes sp.]EIV6181099.1 hypothetical protein [Klebsiella aerogenes]EIV6706919.1 hypothetical protein [Klebsiella aerogenes]EIV9526528.1 hypothetical protein [Klebsiella aerogenes]EIW8603951.1 hypothetical protein [Klebsiella aerogenes]
MPHKLSIWQWIALVMSAPNEALKVGAALAAGELSRWLLGERTRFRYVLGDFIACVLIYCALRPYIPALPPIYGFKISPDLVVLVIALLGAHGIKEVVVAVAKKFGIQLNGESKNG